MQVTSLHRGDACVARMTSRRHRHKPYAGGMLPAYFPVATMAATYNTTIPT
jgi:hypothetical protein